ncbi:NAD(P)H-dependent oxidoreductase [Quadrisphaera sp. DSM 44207]|uniref:NAD(P)H-dependent oxidoreductase n=1 Tax=Quadrisphaera sp. DSM 44207 TaxID=1881057 RepID=UPI000890F291|nr:Gfo/Idh/MocA family oxidoreductase [Quadrisphaera sp. DSM 44207]SDQ68654.1 Predicted homoserine dehydrogenase, contains C-terminal SAF domain [Quadrisphaera sp. DSM 44207]
MILVDTVLQRRQREGRPIRVGMVGAGFQGRGLANQIVNSTPGMELVAIANRTEAKGLRAYEEAGVAAKVVDSRAALERAVREGTPAVVADALELVGADGVDCVVDVTGAVEHGARVTLAALDAGTPVVTMNAELDATVGPELARRSARAGVVFTGADGDQPGVEVNLLRFVRGIGATPLVAGNIKGLQDPYRTPTTQAAFAERWGQDPWMVTSFADGTKISFEQAVVANAWGLTVPARGMNGWDHPGHVDGLTGRYDVEELRALGGVVDYVVGARPSPGVYVLATHDDPKQRHYLDLYKLGQGPLYSFYTPYHLCHFEVPSTVVRAVDLGDAALVAAGGPRVEVLTTAKTDLRAGTVIDGLGGYHVYGQAEDAGVAREQRLLPLGLAPGCTLAVDVPKDAVIGYEQVRVPVGRVVDELRAAQDGRSW